MNNDLGYMFRLVLAIPKFIHSDCGYMFRLELAIPS